MLLNNIATNCTFVCCENKERDKTFNKSIAVKEKSINL